jgi:hypothetical protein
VTDTPVELWDGPRRIARFDPRPLGVSLCPSVREADERAALVHHQPAAFDGELHARAVKVSVAREDLGRPRSDVLRGNICSTLAFFTQGDQQPGGST